MGEMLSSDSLSCKAQEIPFEHRQKPDSIKSRRNHIEGFSWKTIKVISSKFEKATLRLAIWRWFHEPQGSIYFPSKKFYGLKELIFFFFILMSLLSYHLRLKKSFHCEESYLTLEWHDKITSWTASEVGSQKFRRDEHWFLWKLVQAYCPYIENITQNIQNMHNFFPRSKHQCFP